MSRAEGGSQEGSQREEQREEVDLAAQPQRERHVAEEGPPTRLKQILKLPLEGGPLLVGANGWQTGEGSGEERVDGGSTHGVVADGIDDRDANKRDEPQRSQEQKGKQNEEPREDPEGEPGETH